MVLKTDREGKFENLLHDENCKVKRLIVNPKKDFHCNTII